MLDNHVLYGFDIAVALRSIQCPLLLLSGEWEKGSVMREADVAFVRQLVPQAITETLNAGHQVQDDQPQHVLQAINTFLERIQT